MNFKEFMESQTREFLSQAMDDFPNPSSLLILADYLEDDGERHIPQLLRKLVRKEDLENTEEMLKQSMEELKDVFVLNRGGRASIEVQGKHGKENYYWNGNSIAMRPWHGGSTKPVDIKSIENPEVLKGLAILAGLFFAEKSLEHGLKRDRNEEGRIFDMSRKQIKERMKDQDESQLRKALRQFLVHFESVEETVRKINRLSRPRLDDRHYVRQMLDRSHLGYQLDLETTEHVIRMFVQRNGVTPFLRNLGMRINSVLSLVQEPVDNRVAEALTRIVDLTREQ